MIIQGTCTFMHGQIAQNWEDLELVMFVLECKITDFIKKHTKKYLNV